MRLRKPAATEIVLGLLCLMYLITYVDRTNVATAAGEIRKELKLTATQWGYMASAFGYPYILFQIFGGWVGDRFGPRRTLFACGLVWATATILTGLAGGFMTLFLVRVMLGFGEGATFPVATRAMQAWTPPDRRGFAQGITHACARFGNAITPPIVAWLVVTISWRRFVPGARVSEPCVGRRLGDVLSRRPGRASRHHDAELDRLPRRGAASEVRRFDVPWKRLAVRMLPVTIVYFCYGWTLWLYLNWLPQFFLQEYKVNIMSSARLSSTVFAAGVVGDYVGGLISDHVLRRTGDLGKARRNVVVVGFLSSALFLVPVFMTRDLTVIVISLAGAFSAPSSSSADVGDSDGHRAEVFRDRERLHEHRLGGRRGAVAACVWLHRRRDRQLARAVHRFAGPAAPRRCARIFDASGTSLRRRADGGCRKGCTRGRP